MRYSNRLAFMPVSIGRLANSQRWTWGVVVMATLVCGVIAWLHFQQQQTLERTAQTLDTIRQARIDLTAGFLHLMLADDPASPFNREQGLALLGQAMASFDQAAAGLEQTEQYVSAFQDDAAAFRDRLAAWNTPEAAGPEAEAELRIAFDRLEGQADRLDQEMRSSLQALSNRLDAVYVWTLSGAAVLLAGICGAVFFAERARQVAEAERKQTEEALRESEARYRALVEISPEAIFVQDETHIYYTNPAGARLYGLEKPEDLLGRSTLEFVHPDYKELLAQRSKQLRQGEPTPLAELQIVRQDGAVMDIEVRSTPVLYQGRSLFQSVARDITKRKRAEAELRQRTAELARSNAELEHFAYVASHDLHEPLRMVSSFMQLLARRYQGQLDATAHEYIAFAIDGANRMKTLINDLLVYSRVGTKGKPLKPTDCAMVLEQVLTSLQLAIQENEATVTYGSLPTVLADETQLGQLFQNLLGNALKFRSAAPPRIHISARLTSDFLLPGINSEIERPPASRLDLPSKAWLFSVQDNGIGLEPQFAERIFIIFQRLTTKSEYPGTGIGLAICKKIVERHGGRIWVESEPGQGATFYFILPNSDPNAATLTADH